MNSNLTRVQQRALCRELGGGVKLKLLFKASIHGFSSAAFHQRCDGRGPTLSVAYNSSAHVFGGFTTAAFAQTNGYVNDQKAFLFSFRGDQLLKYPTTNSAYAVRMVATAGPYFGESLILMNQSQAAVHSAPGNYYNFPAEEMHGNDLQLLECEVYQVEESSELDRPWRPMVWLPQRRQELMDTICSYKPLCSSVSQVRVLVVGPVGAGKSSFFNSINSVFRGHVTSQAMAGSSGTSLTTKFRTYSVKNGRQGKPLPIILCDTMGLEDSMGAGLDIDDISSILKGHTPDGHQFNSSAPLHSESLGYRSCPELQDQVHCVLFILDATSVSMMPEKLEAKLSAVRRKANLLNIPQLTLVSKVDEACPLVKEDLTNVYKSGFIKDLMQEAAVRLGLPLSCVLPLKNYSEELELEVCVDVLLLTALQQTLRFADNYFDDLSDRLQRSRVANATP
ncbi:unnamed protein product [Knipowitschia caucasica]